MSCSTLSKQNVMLRSYKALQDQQITSQGCIFRVRMPRGIKGYFALIQILKYLVSLDMLPLVLKVYRIQNRCNISG